MPQSKSGTTEAQALSSLILWLTRHFCICKIRCVCSRAEPPRYRIASSEDELARSRTTNDAGSIASFTSIGQTWTIRPVAWCRHHLEAYHTPGTLPSPSAFKAASHFHLSRLLRCNFASSSHLLHDFSTLKHAVRHLSATRSS